jgi:hypothetical protein
VNFIKILEGAAAPFFLDRRGLAKLIWGALLFFFPVAVFFALGYILRILEERLREGDRQRLPSWSASGELFLRGVVFFLVILTYSAIPAVFTLAAVRMLDLGFVFLLPGIVILALAVLLWLVCLYITPMAMALLLVRRRTMDAFALGEIWRRTSMNLPHYLEAVILNLAFFLLAVVPSVANPAVGYIISSPLIFLAMVLMASVYGGVIREILPA